MVSLTKIDPSEIPEVSHKFLMRGDRDRKESERSNGENEKDKEKGFGWSKRNVPNSRSGRIIKGRGTFRYRTPSRSRSRSVTPPHWKVAQKNVIKMTDFERLEEEKKARQSEINRRAEERKRRHHEALTKGDEKKSFYELNQEKSEVETNHVITVASSLIRPIVKSGSDDLNDALDYEESDSDKEQRNTEIVKKPDVLTKKNGRSKDRSPIRARSRSRDRFVRERRDFKTDRNRFNDNRRWDNNRSFNRNRWRRSCDRRSRSRSRSR